MIKSTIMLAVVLCGGLSFRMGTDKGLIDLQGMSWAGAAAEKMAALSLDVVCSVNENQKDVYATIFSAENLVTDNTAILVNGPLLGVLSVHLQYPLADLFVLACDMPLMEDSSLQILSTHYQQQPAEAWVFSNNGVYEPLCAIYSARGLARILQLQRYNKLARHSMKYVLEKLDTLTVQLPADQKTHFRNFNTAADLNEL